MKTKPETNGVAPMPATLTNARHTPGPFRVACYNGETKILDGNNVIVAELDEWKTAPAVAEMEANANLFAASPELLGLAEMFAGLCDESGALIRPTMEQVENARAVIRLAKGDL